MAQVAAPQTPAPAEEPSTQDFASLLNDDHAPTPDAPSSEASAAAAEEPTAATAAAAPAAPTSTATPTAAPSPTPSPAAAAAPITPAEEKLKFRGKDWTMAELTANPDVLRDALTTAEQFPHLQKKYLETLEASRQQPTAQPQPQVPTQPAPKITGKMLVTAYEPEMKQLADAGDISSDMVELYPEFVAQGLFLRDQLLNEISTLKQQVAAVGGYVGGTAQERQRAELVQHIGNLFDHVAAQGGPFELLKDPAVRQGFARHLFDVNPTPSQLTPEFVGRQFVAFNQDFFLEAAARGSDAAAAREAEARRTAVGANGGARPPRAPAQDPSHLEWLNDGLQR